MQQIEFHIRSNCNIHTNELLRITLRMIIYKVMIVLGLLHLYCAENNNIADEKTTA